jgi:hypothetical protein
MLPLDRQVSEGFKEKKNGWFLRESYGAHKHAVGAN